MPSRESGAPLDAVREAAAQRVEDSSLRAVAAEIGIAHSTLAYFLGGAEPYEAVRKKLRAWYGRGTNAQTELVKLRREVERLRKELAECRKGLKRK